MKFSKFLVAKSIELLNKSANKPLRKATLFKGYTRQASKK